jgi:hypothetical protein
MSYDEEWPDQTLENRRKVVRETIRPATYEDLRQLGEKRFPVATDPWCERYNVFLSNNKNSKFYLAKSPEGAEIAYCRETNNGIWFLAGKGMGIVQPKGLHMLAEIVDSL